MDINSLLDPNLSNQYKNLIHNQAHEAQDKTLDTLLKAASKTKFARDHDFDSIQSPDDFTDSISTTDYSYYQEYMSMILRGDKDVLWPGRPLYLATTSASTGYPKFIPVTKESIATFIAMPVRTMLQYVHDEQDTGLFGHNFMYFTDGSSTRLNSLFTTGSISSYCRQMLPVSLVKNSLPSAEAIALIDQKGWDAMFVQAAIESKKNSISVCSGLPSWIWQYLNVCKTHFKTDNLSDILPELKLICSSGVSLKPYKNQLQNLFEQKLNFREFYSASEGAFAYQDSSHDSSMLLNLADGIYFEFVELEFSHNPNAVRIKLSDVKEGIDYVPVVSTNAGLWAYKMGDIVRFTSLNPFRIEIVGRTKHFISIFLESVHSRNVEDAVSEVSHELGFKVTNFTVAPSVIKENNKPSYEWFLELDDYYDLNKRELEFKLDYHLKKSSISYRNARNKEVLEQSKVSFLSKGAFFKLLQSKNVSSLQLKVPKLQNDRTIAKFLISNELVLSEEQFA